MSNVAPTTWLVNAFSLSMLGEGASACLVVRRLDLEEARVLSASARSAVGHRDTATLFGVLLGRDVPFAREHLSLRPGDTAIVGQYTGPRLPEGATSLPEGAGIAWFEVRVLPSTN